MPLAIQCPGCRKTYNLPDNLTGKKVRCVQCRTEFPVYAPVPESEELVEVHLEETSPNVQPQPRKLPAAAPPRTSPRSAPREPRLAPRPAGSFLLPMLLICAFFGSSTLLAVVAGVGLYFLVPLNDGELTQNHGPKGGPPGIREDVFPKRPFDEAPPPREPREKGPPRGGPDDFPRPGEFPPDPRLAPMPPPEPPKPAEPELKDGREPAQIKLPEPKAIGNALASRGMQVADLKLTAFTLPGTLPCLCWSADAAHVFAVEGNGILRRIAMKDFQEEKRLETGRQIGWLSPSAEGLVLTITGNEEVWLVDPEQLEVKKRIAVPAVRRAVSAAALATAFAATTNGDLLVLDLKTGQSRTYRRENLRELAVEHLTASPDGKYLFGQGGSEQLIRFRIDGTKVVYEEASERIAQNGQSICVSPDSEFVCLPSGGGNSTIPGQDAVGYGTYIFRTTNLRQPTFGVRSGAYPQTVGFDAKAGLVYAQNFDSGLITFTSNGVKRQEYKFGGSGVRQFLVHPDGKKLFIHAGAMIYWAELGVAGPPVAPVPPNAVDPRPMTNPVTTNESLAGEQRKINDADVTTVRLNPRDMVDSFCWAADGQGFYCAERSGTVRLVALSGFKELARHDLQRTCFGLAVSSEGVALATLENGGEVLLLNAKTLKIERKVKVPAVSRVVAAPAAPYAFVLAPGPNNIDQLTVLDLRAGKVIGSPEKPPGDAGFNRAVVTPDGKYLIGQGGGALHRFAIADGQVRYEESSPKADRNRSDRLPISSDGRYVCVPGLAAVSDRKLPVYEIANIQKAAVTLELPGLAAAVGFDPKRGAFYVPARDATVTVLDGKGQAGKKYQLEMGTGFVKQYLVHPDGGKLLVVARANVYWVELPK